MSDSIRVANICQLPHGRVLSFYPELGGTLRVHSGRLWVTSDHSQGDYFLAAGDTFDAPAGAHVVAEAWNQSRGEAAVFEWTAVTSPHPPSPEQTSAASR